MLLSQLLRTPVGSRLVRTELDGTTLTLGIATTTSHSTCPSCRRESWRIHNRYSRTLAEEPIFGHRVRLQLTVRRFFCREDLCPRRVFAETLDGLAARYARTTTRLARAQLAIGSALGGEAGAGLAEKLAEPTSPDTLLRRVKRAEARSPGFPRYIGIDDWAWRKGQRYGTIVVDLETGEVIDLLPDRDAATVKVWLAAHPGVEVISRDRSSTYSQAASEASPEARQVVDRWHLLKNVREAVERLLKRRYSLIADALRPADRVFEGPGGTPSEVRPPATLSPGAPAPGPTPVTPREEAAPARRGRCVERFERVHELRRQGEPIRAIARELGMARNSVCRHLRCRQCPGLDPVRRRRRSRLDGHREWIDARIAEERINAAELRHELASQGVSCSYQAVRRYLNKRLGRAGKRRPRINATMPQPSARHLSFDWGRRPERRLPESEIRLVAIRAADPELAAALETLDVFAALIRQRSSGSLKEWLPRAEASPCPEVRHFSEGLRRR